MRINRIRSILFTACAVAVLLAGGTVLLRPGAAHSQAAAIVIDHTAVAQFDQIPDSYIQAASQLTMLFRHASVGNNISDGLDCLGNNFDTSRPYSCDRDIPPDQVLYDTKYDRNNWDFEFHNPPPGQNPIWGTKVAFFIERVDGLATNSYDYAGFKFGYVDGVEGGNIVELFWNRNTDPRFPGVDDLEALQARRPDVTLVWWTMGLARAIGTQEATDFNAQMRAYAADHPIVLMDIADIESHRPDGSPCVDNQGHGLPALCDEYTEEVDGGHLNALAKQRMAKAVWVMMARLAGWNPGGPAPTATSTPRPTQTTGPTPTRTPTPRVTPPTPNPTPVPTSNDVIFRDSFESGNLATWDATDTDNGDLGVSPAAALEGGAGLRATFDDDAPLYVADTLSSAEPRYRVRFLFDPNSSGMAVNDSYMLFEGESNASAVLRTELRRFNNAYQLRVMVRNDTGDWVNTGWWVLSDAPHAVELDWQAAAAGAGNGSLTLWIDGIQRSQLAGLDNDTHRLSVVRLGAVYGVQAGTRGAVYFDAFEARRSSYIGLPAGMQADVSDQEGVYQWTEETLYLPSVSR